MNTYKDLVKTLCDDEVIRKALELMSIDRGNEGFNNAFPIEKYEISFRLYKPYDNVVNLEFLCYANNNKFYQPVGFYKSNEIYLLNEYVEAYNDLLIKNIISRKVIFLNIKENAVIAAFSIQAVEYSIEILKNFYSDGKPMNSLEKYDKFAEINGLSCELLLCNEGYPQLYIDDKYNLNGHIGAYIPNSNGLNLGYPKNIEKEYFELMEQELLTAFTKF
jgi:hypothetical protein